jgi:hypothetical protein
MLARVSSFQVLFSENQGYVNRMNVFSSATFLRRCPISLANMSLFLISKLCERHKPKRVNFFTNPPYYRTQLHNPEYDDLRNADVASSHKFARDPLWVFGWCEADKRKVGYCK